jgi:DNA-binding NarL/FixJ family response regulator
MSALAFLVVDDHPLFLEALQSALEVGFPTARVEVASTIGAAVAVLGKSQFNLVLLDLKMPDVAGFDGLAQIRKCCPRTPVAIISAMAGPDIINRVKGMGVDGFIHKSQPRQAIVKAAGDLLSGHKSFPEPGEGEAVKTDAVADEAIEKLRQLTPQQFKVLTKVCEAKLNKQIAFELGVTETTIKAHITLIFKKLGVHSRTQTVLLLQRLRGELENTELSHLLSAEG